MAHEISLIFLHPECHIFGKNLLFKQGPIAGPSLDVIFILKVDDANPSMGLKLSYRSKCMDGRTLMDTNVCDGVKVSDKVEFEVTLEALHCVLNELFKY